MSRGGARKANSTAAAALRPRQRFAQHLMVDLFDAPPAETAPGRSEFVAAQSGSAGPDERTRETASWRWFRCSEGELRWGQFCGRSTRACVTTARSRMPVREV